jgi:hypothetical protein
MTGENDRLRRTLGAVETGACLGEESNSSPKERESYLQRMWAQGVVCKLLAPNMGSLAVMVSLTLSLLARNVSRKRPLFAGLGITVCKPLQVVIPMRS